MTNNPLRKARKKVKEKKAKYEVNPSPELKQDIEKWEGKINALLNCKIKDSSKKKKSQDKTDEQLFNEAKAYNRLHRNDLDVKVKEEYEKHIQYTLVIKEIMQHSNCSQEEAENLFKQISLQKSQMKEEVPQIEDEQYSDKPIPE